MTELLHAGRAQEAERACRQILARAPRDPAPFHYALGYALLAQGRAAEAEQAWRRAVALAPRHWEAVHALAMLLKQRGAPEEALGLLQKAAQAPDAGAEVHFNLGAMRWERRQARLAIESFRRAVTLNDRFAPAWRALGIAHRSLNENDEAVSALRRAVGCDPGNPAFQLALGQVLLDLNRPGADEPLGKAAQLAPDDPRIADEHAQALVAAGRLDEAEGEHRRARALGGDQMPFRLSHARSLALAGRWQDAGALLEQAASDPGPPAAEKASAQAQLAAYRLLTGEVAGARTAYDAALELAPDDAGHRLQRAMLLLSLGEFAEGWPQFESRFVADMRSGGILAQPFPQPRWDGSDLTGKSILVWSEQGVGDDVIFASMIPDLARRARRVLIHCDARLVSIFARSFAGNVQTFPRVLPVQPELLSAEIDWQIPFGSFGRFLRSDWASFGQPTAYLRADPERVAYFRQRYADRPGLKIGLAWRSQNLVTGRFKSSDLSAWGPILTTPGLSFINLQYGDCAAALAQARRTFGADIFADPEVDQLVDMDTFAAQVAALDGVVAIGSVMAHTSGALGVPTYVLLATDPLWVWFRDRQDSVWYPNVRVFRQSRPFDWSDPVKDVAAALAHRPQRAPSRSSDDISKS